VRGDKKIIIQFQSLTTPTPPSPVEGEEEKGSLFMVYGASERLEEVRLTFQDRHGQASLGHEENFRVRARVGSGDFQRLGHVPGRFK
jgi:hypothetical protein